MNTYRTLRRTLVLFLMTALLLQSCSFLSDGASGAASSDASHPAAGADAAEALTAFTNDEIRLGIQEALDDYARAYNRNDPALLKRAVDQDNLPFRRMVQTLFDDYQQSIYAGTEHFEFTVKSVSPMTQGFMLAHIAVSSHYVLDWTFRYTGENWVISEPTLEQLGEPEYIEKEHFTFETYRWNRDYNEEIMQLMESAAAHVETDLGKIPEGKVFVSILPGYSAVPDLDPSASAYYFSGSSLEDDAILIFSPISMNFGSYDSSKGWQPELEEKLVHEYTHLAHKRAFGDAGKMMDWLTEGLAEYVCESSRVYEVSDALAGDQLIPIIDEQRSAYQQDLMHLYLLESDVSLGYAEAEALVMYITTTYGGMDAVWKLAEAHDRLQDLDAALEEAFHISFAEFDSDWRDWLEIHFGA